MSSETGSPRCLNCGAEIHGQFCSECGQEDNELRVSLKRLTKDFFAEQLGLESKVPTTLWTLVSRPGRLTADYLAGRRVRSLLPLRLYLSASVIYFLLLSLPIFGTAAGPVIKITTSDRTAMDAAKNGNPAAPRSAESSSAVTFGTIYRAKMAARKPANGLRAFVQKRMKRYDKMTAPELLVYFKEAFVRYMPNAVFILLPVFSLILYLLYRKTGRFFAEHLIFALHIHAFAFVALTISLLTPGALDVVFPVWILVYLFLALRRVYSEPRKRTAAKFAALLLSYMFILQITILGVIGAIFAFG